MKLSRIFQTKERKGLRVQWFNTCNNLIGRGKDYPQPPDQRHIGKLTLFYRYDTIYVFRVNSLNLNLSSFGPDSGRLLQFLENAELGLDASGHFVGFNEQTLQNIWLKESLSDEEIRRLEEFVIYREKLIRGDVNF